MSVQSWMIKSWATVEWYLPPGDAEGPGFWHVSSQVREESDPNGLRSGDTVWATHLGASHVGMAWEWVEVRPGLVMLADPNSIITNLQLVDSKGAAVLGLSRTIAVNRLVHALAWQNAVCALLRARPAPAPLAPTREALTSEKPETPLFAADTAHTAAPMLTAHYRPEPDGMAASSVYEAPALQRFKERRLRSDGNGRNRATDHEEFPAAARTQALRKAA